MRPALVRLGLLAAALIAATWLVWTLVQRLLGDVSLASIEAWVEAAGLWAPVVSVALMVVHTFIPFPAELLAAANGMLFGAVRGTVVTWIAGLAGAASGYAVGALLARWLIRAPGHAEPMARARHLVDRHGTAGLIIARLLPIISFNVIDYAAGALRVSLWKFTWTTAVGILPWVVIMTAGGTKMVSALQGDAVALGLLAGLAAIIALSTWLAHRRYWRRAPVPPPGDRTAGHDAPTRGEDAAARLTVRDMACGLCVRKVTAPLCAEPGVRHVEAAADRHEVSVRFDPERTSLQRLTEVVRDEGFAVEEVVS